MKDSTRIFILSVFSIIWICKPIPYETVSHRQYVRHQHQKTVNKVLEIPYSGGRESTSNSFVPQYRGDPGNRQGSGQESSQGFNAKPRLTFGPAGDNGSGGSSGGGGSFDDNNVPRKSQWETNPDYWNNYKYDPNSFKNKENNQECELEKKVEEKFDESNAVKKLVGIALKNQDVKNEYDRIKKRLEEGINPVDIGKKSTPVASNKVLIKGDEGRYLVEVSGDQIKVLGMCARGNKKNVNSFKTLMNEMYGVNLKY